MTSHHIRTAPARERHHVDIAITIIDAWQPRGLGKELSMLLVVKELR
jgi:hypothetical protein